MQSQIKFIYMVTEYKTILTGVIGGLDLKLNTNTKRWQDWKHYFSLNKLCSIKNNGNHLFANVIPK